MPRTAMAFKNITTVEKMINELDVLRLHALRSANPEVLLSEYMDDYHFDYTDGEIDNDVVRRIVENVPKTSRYHRLYPAVVLLPDDLSTLEADLLLPGKVQNFVHTDGSLTISRKAFADDALACLQQIRPRIGGRYPPGADRVTRAILAMDERANEKHGYSGDEYERMVPLSLLVSLAERFVIRNKSEKTLIAFADVAQPEKGVGRMFLPVGEIRRGGRVVARVSEEGDLTLLTTDRSDALAVIGGVRRVISDLLYPRYKVHKATSFFYCV